MGYYLRFFSTDTRPITAPLLEEALKEVDPGYALADEELSCGGELYALVSVDAPPDPEEIEEFVELVEETRGRGKKQVLEVLQSASAVAAIQVLQQGRETEATFARIDPLSAWLLENRQGLLQADGEGFYDREKLILRLE